MKHYALVDFTLINRPMSVLGMDEVCLEVAALLDLTASRINWDKRSSSFPGFGCFSTHCLPASLIYLSFTLARKRTM
jgi:hypothetical protein